jgi:hypothetical protein
MTAPHLSWRNLPVRPLRNRLRDADSVVTVRSATKLHLIGISSYSCKDKRAILPSEGVDASN